jgi:hypothetical protein
VAVITDATVRSGDCFLIPCSAAQMRWVTRGAGYLGGAAAGPGAGVITGEQLARATGIACGRGAGAGSPRSATTAYPPHSPDPGSMPSMRAPSCDAARRGPGPAASLASFFPGDYAWYPPVRYPRFQGCAVPTRRLRPATAVRRGWLSGAVMGSCGIGHFGCGRGAVDLGGEQAWPRRRSFRPAADMCAAGEVYGRPARRPDSWTLGEGQPHDDTIARRAGARHGVPVRAYR